MACPYGRARPACGRQTPALVRLRAYTIREVEVLSEST